MPPPFILWLGIVALAWLVFWMVKRRTIDAAIGLAVAWAVFFTAPFFIPQVAWPVNIGISMITTMVMLIVATLYFHSRDESGEVPNSDSEKSQREDFRNGVAMEVYSILKMFVDALHHWDIAYPSWSGKTEQSKAAILGKEDYLVLRSLYDAIEERNNYFTRTGGIDLVDVDPLNLKCIEAFSRAYSEVTWLKVSSDTDSLLSEARRNVGLDASEANMKRQEERMRLVYAPLHSAVASMRLDRNDPQRRYGLGGTPFNPWKEYPEIMQNIINVFVNYPDLVENEEVWNGWQDKEDDLRNKDVWLNKTLYPWFDAIEEEYHRIDSELKAGRTNGAFKNSVSGEPLGSSEPLTELELGWHLSGDVQPVPPFGSQDMPGSDEASTLHFAQRGKKITLTGNMRLLKQSYVYHVELGPPYTAGRLIRDDNIGGSRATFTTDEKGGASWSFSITVDELAAYEIKRFSVWLGDVPKNATVLLSDNITIQT